MKNPADVCLVFTSWPSAPAAELFARAAIEARLAACVHVGGAGVSIYRWDGHVERAAEHHVVIKTTRDRVAALEALLTEAHPYDVPEYLVCDADASHPYRTWVRDSVSDAADSGGPDMVGNP